MLELVDVTKKYGFGFPRSGVPPGDAGDVCVLKGITLKVAEGQSLVIVGPSGSGKSTLLNIIGALDRPTTGRVLLDGRDLAQLDEIELARIRNQEIGFVFQLHHLLPQCTVLENVLVPTLAEGRRTRHDRRGTYDEGRKTRFVFHRQSSFVHRKARLQRVQERAINLLQRVGLKDYLLHRPGELSVGQRQRVAVVRALINRPRLLLADEPTGSLDEKTSQSIADLLVELNRSEGVALIVVTHSLKLAECMGHVMELADGLLRDPSRRSEAEADRSFLQ